ncbi:radical SAM protein [uncultured Thomasclavelia sp.]|uniref:radical SAM protein n=1 Tax=uncultured Thomasclavelia sp. TaxID=3025759 RepID=UPI0025D40C4E|nr:radical SAM protein [uncultured Thomasclavelia sp.]
MKFTYEKFLIGKGNQKHVPLNASLELLPLCNMNCDMCYVHLTKKEMEAQGRLLTGDEWLEIGRKMQQAGTLFVILTGGEPLLYPEFKKVYLGLKKLGMIITINTNGTLIDEQWADFFATHLPRRINITLYGGNEQTYQKLCHYPGGFQKAIRAIKLLRQRNVDVKMNGSLVKANQDDLEEIINQAEELKVPLNIDTYMYPATRERHRPYNQQARLNPQEAARAKQIFNQSQMSGDEYYNLAKQVMELYKQTPAGDEVPGKMKCQAGKTSFTVNWQGYMRPCVMLTKPAISLLETDLKMAWETLQTGIGVIELSSKCQACKMRDVCDTCGACALLETGDFQEVPEYMCEYTKETLRIYQEYIKQHETD